MTLKAQEALQESQALARTYGHPEIRPLHLVLALTRQPEGIVAPILEKLGADPRAVAAAAEGRLKVLPRVEGQSEIGLSRALVDILEVADRKSVG
jgi:ATP-dependent Clp protease ATP-binding subunit ClpB